MQRHLKPVVPTVQLSVEEEAILLDEQNQTMNGLVADAAVIDRVVEANDIIIDAEHVVSQVSEMGSVETELVAAVGDMAVAGTDAEPEVMTPATGVATEGFLDAVSERLAKIWAEIKKFLLKMWESIKAFFRAIGNFFSPIKREQDAVEAVLKKNEEAEKNPPPAPKKEAESGPPPEFKGRGNTARVDIDYNGDFAFLSMMDKNSLVPPERMVGEVKKLTKVASDTIQGFLDLQQDLSLPVLEMVRKTIADPATAGENMTAIKDRVEAIQKSFFQKMHFNPGDKIAKPAGLRSQNGYPDVIGGLHVEFYRTLPKHSDNTFDFCSYMVTQNKSHVGRFKTKSLTSDEVKEILEESRRFTTAMENGNLVRDVEELEKLSSDMVKMVDGLKLLAPQRPANATLEEKLSHSVRDRDFSRVLHIVQATAVVGLPHITKVIKYTSEILKHALKLGHQSEKMTGFAFMGVKIVN